MVELRNKGYVPVAWTYRWAAEDPFMPYDELRERGLRSRTFVELAHDSVVYVFAMRRTNKAEANEFWRRVDDYARVDLWFLFEGDAAPFYVFLEVKSHNGWDEKHVATQVMDQASRVTVEPGPLHGFCHSVSAPPAAARGWPGRGGRS